MPKVSGMVLNTPPPSSWPMARNPQVLSWSQGNIIHLPVSPVSW